jgi:hypothetical protein
MASQRGQGPLKNPITFAHERVEPDTILLVFKQPFYVHSVVIRIQSAFFRTFIDSADKANSNLSGQFKYEWITEVDSDNKDWALVGVTTETVSSSTI